MELSYPDFALHRRISWSGSNKLMSVTHVVQLVVEPTSVADWLTGLIPPPESRGRRLAVGTAGARPSRRTLQ